MNYVGNVALRDIVFACSLQYVSEGFFACVAGCGTLQSREGPLAILLLSLPVGLSEVSVGAL